MSPNLLDTKPHDDDTFRTLCRANRWRCTAQRRAVFFCLCGNREHPSVEMIWRTVKKVQPDISLDSVYRILDAFAEAGLIRRMENAKAVRYDSNTGRHDHFVCSECGAMLDFVYPDSGEVVRFCRDLGSVAAVDLCVRGVCNACREKHKPR